ncbi:hypothetical protein [Streptomyces sp. NPDC093094]|uniref:hypothetical protein n=1 Tax=Streptomyces sp. NPDC093094 TaxID=3366026 RepID=UPI003829EC81
MGIRMLNRRPAHPPLAPVPAFAAGASTARIAVGPVETARHAAVGLGHALARCRPFRAPGGPGPVEAAGRPRDTRRRLWADQARGYLALLLTLLPRARPVRTLTVFVAPVPALSGPPDGSAPCWSRPEPGPGATP